VLEEVEASSTMVLPLWPVKQFIWKSSDTVTEFYLQSESRMHMLQNSIRVKITR
jgi:hypothetical protein